MPTLVSNPFLGIPCVGEYPWQAAVLKKDEYDNVYICGAALIDGSHLLTATHCINQYRPEELRVGGLNH